MYIISDLNNRFIDQMFIISDFSTPFIDQMMFTISGFFITPIWKNGGPSNNDGLLSVVQTAANSLAEAIEQWEEKLSQHARNMAKAFKVGDHVSCNSEGGRVSGRIVRVHTKDVNHKGYIHHASKANPQYEIKSDKTDHVALHKSKALRHLRR